MNQADLDFMKEQVLAGNEPWKGAFERLKASIQLDIEPPTTNFIRGGWGEVGGGGALLRNAYTFYDCALVWYITRDEQYVRKALEIIENLSGRMWFFEENDAKLAGGTAAHPLCAGAEILRYHYHGWSDKHTEQLSRMLMEIYYPLLRFYFSEANGNWDAVIARALLSIAVFTDNRPLFDDVIFHLIHAPANGSLFKYFYPSGQIQETTRNLAHAQMGLAEFAGAARIAYTQGVDLFSLGNNRIALGFEYTMGIIFGETPHSYGVFSTQNIHHRRELYKDYEFVYQHYAGKGVRMPMTRRISDEVRDTAGRGVLTAFRAEFQNREPVEPFIDLHPSPIAFPAGATRQAGAIPANAIEVLPGEDLQAALNQVAGTGRSVVAKTGFHRLRQTLRIPSGTHLMGEGLGTVLMFESVRHYAVIAQEASMHDVRISNLVIEGALRHEADSDPNTGRFNRTGRFANSLTGIAFLGLTPGSMRNIVLENVTVINFSRNGVLITGADNVVINNCNISDNGSRIVPGPRLQHNLLLRHVTNAHIHDSRFTTSLAGCGIALDNCSDVIIERCEIARNAWFGVLLSTSDNVTIVGNLIEGNCGSGIMAEFLHRGCRNVRISDNIIQYNAGYGVEAYAVEEISLSGNQYDINGRSVEQERISPEPQVILNSSH